MLEELATGSGSSPLARGTPPAFAVARRSGRFIPARAGNTTTGRGSPRGTTVHPRSRGEHSPTSCGIRSSSGSSPLARGTPRSGLGGQPLIRFIPARAGNTGVRIASARSRPVHPRSRGEHEYVTGADLAPHGSSPLARGTQLELVRLPHQVRFIPARAGNTSRGAGRSTGRSVHPRSRGEHQYIKSQAAQDIGSSPLARGTHARPPRQQEVLRFIPARAGNTSVSPSSFSKPAVHPRSRGEHSRSNVSKRSNAGSSPLARGTRLVRRPHRRVLRFIPARAGNTQRRGRPRDPPTVHPRSRGEHPKASTIPTSTTGSSPLARGTPVVGHGG